MTPPIFTSLGFGFGAQYVLTTAEGYVISRSLRFNRDDNAYLSRTPASDSNRKTWTWSGWIKRTSISNSQIVFYARLSTTDIFKVEFETADTIFFEGKVAGTNTLLATTTRVFRDTSAWYHLVFSLNASSLQFKVYVNGVEETLTSVTGPSNQDYIVNSTAPHYIGGWTTTANCDFYLAEVNFIDGQALDPTSFGEFDDNGVWQPIDTSGLTYGTNGYYLDFLDNSSAAALGYDTSGNGNDWTVNNISVAAGAGNDSLPDHPTNGDTANDTGLGGQVSGNYCTWNPLKKSAGASLSNGNLKLEIGATGGTQQTYANFGMSSGKWYWEIEVDTGSGGALFFGIAKDSHGLNYYPGQTADGYGFGNTSSSNPQKWHNGVGTSYGSAMPTVGDIVGTAFDATNGTITWYLNGVSQGTAFTGIPADTWFPTAGIDYAKVTLNAGQRPFAYPVAGFKSLCTANLPVPTIADPSTVMDTKLWTGNGTSQTISGLGFSPDFVWIKNRNFGSDHEVYDRTRGAGNVIKPSNTDVEAFDANALLSFTSDGWTLGNGGSVNRNNDPIVGWTWDAGTSNATNTDGTITSTVRANVSAGFSIVTYSAGSGGSTVGHGLVGVSPHLIIAKSRTVSQDWVVYHSATGNSQYLLLSQTAAASSLTNYWGTVGASTFGVSNNGFLNNNGDMVAYCYAPVEGYSAFGSYTGNGNADGTFVYTGFRPKWIMIKRTDSTAFWMILDSERDTYNVIDGQLYPNSSNAETSSAVADFVSNGFKARSTSNEMNTNNGTYIYAAFAETPYKTARAR